MGASKASSFIPPHRRPLENVVVVVSPPPATTDPEEEATTTAAASRPPPMTMREIGRYALSLSLTIEQNIRILEQCIYDASSSSSDGGGGDADTYNNLLFQTIGAIACRESLQSITYALRNGLLGEMARNNDAYRQEQKEDDEFITHPFQVEDGALQCGKCGSKRTISYSKQMRSADEPSTTIATCVACRHRWTYSG